MSRLLLTPFLLFTSVVAANIAADENQDMPALHHPFDIKPSADISIPDSFPLDENKHIECQTCHGIKDIQEQDFQKINKQDENFFREGPYPKLTEFCYRCHDSKQYQRDSIHKMLDAEGKIIKSSCTYCHEKTPDPEKDYKPTELKLRLPVQDICYGCHLNTPHFNALGHQQKPGEDMIERITRYEQDHKIALPLSDDGKITCITCHSAHQIDVIDQEKPAGKQVKAISVDKDKGITYRDHPWNKVFIEDKKVRLEKHNQKTGKKHALKYQRIENESLLRRSAKDGTLCLACHEFDR